ncbi:MAG: hypothetical protein AAGD33_09285 [Actinomycetota bacterium]
MTPRRLRLVPAAVAVSVTLTLSACAGSDDDVAVPTEPGRVDATIVGDEAFEVVVVRRTAIGFGDAALATSEDELSEVWDDWEPGVVKPTVDFDRDVALVMTRPDDACADLVDRFEVTDDDGVPTWTPVFEPPPGGCAQPLLAWLHVVAIDREALGSETLIRVPADDTFGVTERVVRFAAG